MFEEYSDVVTIKELCAMLKIGRTKAYELISSQEIQSVKIGKQIRIPKREVIRFVSISNRHAHVEITGENSELQLVLADKYDIIDRSQ